MALTPAPYGATFAQAKQRVGRCHVPRRRLIPVNLLRELRFEPLFLEPIRMMVIPGLAGMHVQPCPRNNIEHSAFSI